MNSVPKLLDTVRPTLADIAAWVEVSRSLVDVWRSGARQPLPDDKAALLRAIRSHARRLVTLAEKVEREGMRTR